MKGKILVVEDNDQNLYLMTYILEKNGYVVVSAGDGQEAVKKTVAEKPDLIVMDIQLPIMDGYETTKTLKSLPETKDIPIVAVTSYAMVGDREKALSAGCIGYIEKPINPETFMQKLEKYLVKDVK